MEQAQAEVAKAQKALQVGCCKKPKHMTAATHYEAAAKKYADVGDEMRAAECWKHHADILKDHSNDKMTAAKAYDTAITCYFKFNRYTGAILRDIEHCCNNGVDLYLQADQGEKAHQLFRRCIKKLAEVQNDEAVKSVQNIFKKAASLKAALEKNPEAMVEINRVYIDYLAGREKWKECAEQIKKAIALPAYHSASSHLPFAKMLFDLFVLQMDMKEIEKTGEAEAFLEEHAQDGPPAFRGSEEEEWLKKYVQACVEQNTSDAQRALNNGIAPLCSPVFQDICKTKAKAKPLLVAKEGRIVTTTGGGTIKKPIPTKEAVTNNDEGDELDDEADEEEDEEDDDEEDETEE